MAENKLDKNFQELLDEVQKEKGRDVKVIEKAWEFAQLAHHEQMRASGNPYAFHSLKTAEKLAQWKLDTTSIVVGLLHDTVEKGGAASEDVRKEFGEEIEKLVDGVTEISKIELKGSDEELFIENLRKMFLAMAKDIRVVIVRLAERYHNMETLSYMKSDHRVRTSKETLEVFAPLAERLGMGEMKGQLEDLAFEYVYPSEYKKVKKQAGVQYKKAEKHIRKMKHTILKLLAREGVKAKIQARKKHLYSLWRKLERSEKKWNFTKIHDVVALRILVDDVSECYKALGTLHATYKPVPSIGIRDYIAQPKPNGYRSIHANVFGPKKRIVEVQIRTQEMHEEAERGVAAHWYYSGLKVRGKLSSEDIDKGVFRVSTKKLKWVKQLAEWQKEIKDSKEFLEAVKFDTLSQRIFVFSPKGDVFDLPFNSTPVDFAYAVHTDLGRYIKAAKVNGKITPLNFKLKNRDVVEILKTKDPKKPSSHWLNFVVTTLAKRNIKRHLSASDQKG